MTSKRCQHCAWWDNYYGKPADSRPHEIFRFLHIDWDIDIAKEILQACPRDPVSVPVSAVKDIIDYPVVHNSGSLFKVFIYAEHIAHVDCDVPCIVGFFPPDTPVISGNGSEAKQVLADGIQAPRKRAVIDGHHRIARAVDLNLESLPAYLLTEEESDFICYSSGKQVSVVDPRKRKADGDITTT